MAKSRLKKVTDPPPTDRDSTWQERLKRHYKGKPRKAGKALPKGTFNESPSEIARRLRWKSDTVGEAMSRISYYLNSQGKNINRTDKTRVWHAKDAVRNAFGIHNKAHKPMQPKQPTIKAVTQSLHMPRDGHNLDDPFLETGVDVEGDDRARQFTANALTRLVATRRK